MGRPDYQPAKTFNLRLDSARFRPMVSRPLTLHMAAGFPSFNSYEGSYANLLYFFRCIDGDAPYYPYFAPSVTAFQNPPGVYRSERELEKLELPQSAGKNYSHPKKVEM